MPSKNKLLRPVVIVPVLIVVYFLAFPSDLAILRPLTEVLISSNGVLTQILALSGRVSPWLYILLGVAILSRTVTRIWGQKSQS